MTPDDLAEKSAVLEALAADPGDDALPVEERRAVRLARLAAVLGRPSP